jgi:hypothetical protein
VATLPIPSRRPLLCAVVEPPLLLERLAVVRRRAELLALRLEPLLLRLLLDVRLRLLPLWLLPLAPVLPLARVLRLLPLLPLELALVLRPLPLARRLVPLWRALADPDLLSLLDRLLVVLVADRDAEPERPRLLARFDVPRSLAADISPSCFRLTRSGRFWRLEQVCLGATRGRTHRTPLDECSSRGVSAHGQAPSPGSRTIEMAAVGDALHRIIDHDRPAR